MLPGFVSVSLHDREWGPRQSWNEGCPRVQYQIGVLASGWRLFPNKIAWVVMLLPFEGRQNPVLRYRWNRGERLHLGSDNKHEARRLLCTQCANHYKYKSFAGCKASIDSGRNKRVLPNDLHGWLDQRQQGTFYQAVPSLSNLQDPRHRVPAELHLKVCDLRNSASLLLAAFRKQSGLPGGWIDHCQEHGFIWQCGLLTQPSQSG